ncbi:hypothetical protein [Clostridium sp. LP20]|uniref:hypothetical protein n=1 Tax=Clostridium sp. LP20 TaxID=3418665 RepID=UPI003EE553CA
MSDSVGKISLDLEIQSDISKQVSNVSSMIGNGLKKSLDGGMKSALKNISNISKKSVGNISNTINSSLKNSMGKIKNTMQAAFNSFKNFKLPTFSFQKPTNISAPKVADVSTSMSGRGPPVDMDIISAQIDNVGRSLDNTNARIEQQKIKLAELKEAYATASPSRKNKMEEQILKTEASINKLIGTSDKLGFKLNELDAKFAKAGSGANTTSTSTNKLKSALNGINNASNKASNGLKNLGNSTKKASNSMRQHSSNIGIIVRSMFTWGIVFPIVLKGLTALATTIGQGLMTNQQFANSFNQIKTNMMVAFTPILQAVLPALNILMAALAKATTYIASFMSAIFGKTYQQSYKATQQLIDAKVAMGAYGDSAKKAAKDVKGLAAIDEINTLGATNDNIAGGVINDKIPQLVAPPVDTSSVDKSMKAIVDRVKGFIASIDFTPLKNSFVQLKAAISPIVENIGKTLSWFMDNILKPLAKWTIEDYLPAWLNVLSGVLKVLNPLLEVFIDLGKWLWDSFLQPIASWSGGLIVDILNSLADALVKISEWMKENKGVIEVIAIVVGSFALAWGLVNVAFGIWFGLLNAYNAIVYFAAGGTTTLAAAFTALNWPLILIVAAIGAVIAIGVLLYKHWDVVKAKAIEVWDGICDVFKGVDEFIENIFVTDWTNQFGVLGEMLNAFSTIVHNIWTDIKNIFTGIVDFIAGVFSGDWERAINGLVNILKGIVGGIAEIVRVPMNAVIGIINTAIGGINKIKIDVPDWIPGIGGKSFGGNIPKIPYLAKGGIIDNPTLAMVGEAGKEAVVPLENNTQGLDLLASKLMERLGGGGISDNNKDRAIEIILQLGDLEFARVLIDSINKLTKMNNGQCLIKI